MITKKDVRRFLIYRILGITLIFLVVLEALCLPTHHFFLAVALAAFAILVYLLLIFRFKLSLQEKKFLIKWYKLGQSIRSLPVGKVEKAKLRDWAKGKLEVLAQTVTAAFNERERLSQEVVDPARKKLQELETNEASCDPEGLKAFRRALRQADLAFGEAFENSRHASEWAAKIQKHYGETWDYLTKPEPDGLEILPDLAAGGPELFRALIKEQNEKIIPATQSA